MQLQKDVKQLKNAGIVVVGVSYDPVDALQKFATKLKLSFPLLSDPKSDVITKYGLLNKSAKGRAKGVPNPGTIVVNNKGEVAAKIFLEGYRDRHTTEALLEAVKKTKSE